MLYVYRAVNVSPSRGLCAALSPLGAASHQTTDTDVFGAIYILLKCVFPNLCSCLHLPATIVAVTALLLTGSA